MEGVSGRRGGIVSIETKTAYATSDGERFDSGWKTKEYEQRHRIQDAVYKIQLF